MSESELKAATSGLSPSPAVPISVLSDLAICEDDLLILAAVEHSEDDPGLFFAWSDPAVVTLRGVAAALPMLAVAVPFPIPQTTLAFKVALLAHLAANSAPGVAVIDGPNALGLVCNSAAASLRAITALSHFSDSPWAAALLVAAPPGVSALAAIYTTCAGAAGARGEVERVYPVGGGHPRLFH